MTELERAANEERWGDVKDILLRTTEDRPTAASVELAFVSALQHAQLDIVKTIFQMTTDNKLNANVIKGLLSEGIKADQWEFVSLLIQVPGDNKLSKEIMEELIELAITNKQWAVVQDIILLEGDNKLSAADLEEALPAILANEQWIIIQNILDLKGDNQLAEDILIDAATSAIKKGIQLDLSYTLWTTKYVGNILGLSGTYFEGFFRVQAVTSSYNRFDGFKQLPKIGSLSTAELHLMTIEEAISKDAITQFSSQADTTCQSFICGWEGHSFLVTLFKEGDNIHIIYTNRGEREGERIDTQEDENVVVYTVKNDAGGAAFLARLSKALETQDRTQISTFFAESTVKDKRNEALAVAFAKSSQKTGNCAIANTNMAWHFALAQEYMKQNTSASLKEAFEATKPLYKFMRMHDRVNAFHALLVTDDAAVREDGLLQFLMKDKFNKSYLNELLGSLSNDEVNILKDMTINVDSVIELYKEEKGEDISDEEVALLRSQLEGRNAWDYLLMCSLEVQKGEWDLIRKNIDRVNSDIFGQIYVEWALEQAVKEKNEELVHYILELKDDKKPSTEKIAEAYTKAVESQQWGIAKAILAMNGDNKLPKAVIEANLQVAVDGKLWDIVEAIAAIEGDNKPDASHIEPAVVAKERAKEKPAAIVVGFKETLGQIKEGAGEESSVTPTRLGS